MRSSPSSSPPLTPHQAVSEQARVLSRVGFIVPLATLVSSIGVAGDVADGPAAVALGGAILAVFTAVAVGLTLWLRRDSRRCWVRYAEMSLKRPDHPALLGMLRGFVGHDDVHLIVTRNERVAARHDGTRSFIDLPLGLLKRHPVVDGNVPSALRAVLAHEAGHVAARDARWHYVRLALAAASVGATLAAVVVALVGRAHGGGDGFVVPSAIQQLIAGVAVAASWMAASQAAEIRADAFAVEHVGAAALRAAYSVEPSRDAKPPAATRLKQWLLHPHLAFRTQNAGATGQLGDRATPWTILAVVAMYLALQRALMAAFSDAGGLPMMGLRVLGATLAVATLQRLAVFQAIVGHETRRQRTFNGLALGIGAPVACMLASVLADVLAPGAARVEGMSPLAAGAFSGAIAGFILSGGGSAAWVVLALPARLQTARPVHFVSLAVAMTPLVLAVVWLLGCLVVWPGLAASVQLGVMLAIAALGVGLWMISFAALALAPLGPARTEGITA